MLPVSGSLGVASCFEMDLKKNFSPDLGAENVDVDEGCYEPQFEITDHDLERRLNALNDLVSNLNLKKQAKKQPYPPLQKLIIKPRQQLICDEKQLFKSQNECCKPHSPSCLKSPDSPYYGRKKSVRFADSIGLDLEHVKVFENDKKDRYTHFDDDDFFESDEVTLSPTSGTNLFNITSSWAAELYTTVNSAERYLAKRFEQRKTKEVFDITERQNVCLDSMSITRLFVWGTILVKNISFEKQVYLRYTLDNWRSYVETPCNFLFSNNANNHDVFCFSLCLSPDMPVGSGCKICIRYAVGGENFWDNNNNENYELCCSQY